MAANDVPCCETMFWVYVLVSVALVVFAGLMSGLTLGLMSLSLLDLEVLIKAGQPNDRKNAEKILPIVKNQHLLLCTLLICNSLAMEALPIFLDSVLLPWCAILISVTLVLAFGEIIPQAVCSRYGLAVGAKLAVFVRLLVIVVFPIAYPLSKLLDVILGKGHSVLLRRAELKTLVYLHGNKAGKGGELTNDETTIITGALDLAQKTVKDVMTPLSEIFSLELNSKLNDEAMNLLLSKGHSRVPIYLGRPENIIGLILVKNLIKCRPEDETPLRNLSIRKIPRIHDSLPLYEMLNLFQKGHSHMAVVVKTKHNPKDATEHATPKNNAVKIDINVNSTETKLEEGGLEGQYSKYGKIYKYASSISADDTKPPTSALDQNISNDIQESASKTDAEIIGLITMEDVLEELLQEPILDETDEYVDVHNIIQINMLPRVRTSLMRSPGAALASHPNWQTVVASPLSSSASRSPLSSYHHSPMLGSPHSPFIRSPFVKPTLYGSPGNPMPNSPASPISSSPSSNRVSRKSYEKLKRPGDL